MATTYPVPNLRRLDLRWDDLLWQTLTYTATNTLSSVPFATKDGWDRDTPVSPAHDIPADGGLLLRFGYPADVQAYLLDLATGSAPEILYTRDASPSLTTSTWITAGTSTLTPIATPGSPATVPVAINQVTAIRFQFTGTASVSNLHLYASSSAIGTEVVQADGVTPVTDAYMNFGTGGKNGWKDITFRIQNNSGKNYDNIWMDFTLLSTAPGSGTPIFDQLFLSLDGGVTFKSLSREYSVYFPGVAVGNNSQPLILRRYSPADHDNSRRYVILGGVYTDWDTRNFYVYVGDTDPAEVDPQLWGPLPLEAPEGSSITISAAGVGTTQAEFNTRVYLNRHGAAPVEMPITAWTSQAAAPGLAEDPALVDWIDHRSNIFEPAHADITVTVPDVSISGVYSLQVLSLGAASPKLSNLLPITVSTPVTAIPTTQDGYRLQAVSMSGTVLASNVPYKVLAFTDELSDVGAGKPQFDFDSPFWTNAPQTILTPQFIAENEFIWQVYEGSELRFSFLNSIADDSVVNRELKRVQSTSSEGIGRALSWSVVAPPRFPTVPPYFWTFANARLWQWLTIWAECQLRSPENSIQRRFTPTFTRYTDSAGNAWLDPGFENQQRNGVDMLTLLKEHCDSVGADFHVEPDFRITVIYSRSTIDVPGRYYGVDRKQVIFRDALLKDKRVLRDRSEVKNWVIAQDDYGEVSLRFNESSITKNGMRESYVEAGRSGLLTTRVSRAEEELKWHADQIVSWTLSVEPYYETDDGTVFNRVFVDYKVGDWIYAQADDGTLVSVQVSAITLAVDEQGTTEVELTLESLAALRKRKAELRDAVTSGGGSGAGGSTLVLFEEEIFPVSGETPPTTYDIKYLPLPKSEIITIGMKKFMEVDGSGGLAVREFTRTLRRGEHWERTGWTVTITDPSVFDESF